MRKKDNFWEKIYKKKNDNLVFFVERMCFNNFLNTCVKTLNGSYFLTEGVSFMKAQVSMS